MNAPANFLDEGARSNAFPSPRAGVRMRILGAVRRRFHPLWRLRRSRTYRWFQRTFDFPVFRQFGAVTWYSMFLRDIGLRLSGDAGEPRTLAVAVSLLASGNIDCFVDVGANIGTYAWHVANRRPHAALILFEPDATNVSLLRRTIEASALRQAEINAVALSDRSGTARFVVDDRSGAVGSIVDQRGAKHNIQASYGLGIETWVPTRTLDEYLPALAGRRVLLKVDVEGAEALVFAGGARVLAEVRPLIVCEAFGGAGLAPLRHAGYRIFAIRENSNYLALPEELGALASGLDVVPA